MTEEEPIHLWTGLMVCGKPKSWCGAEFQTEYEEDGEMVRKVKNGTDALERTTCEDCKQKAKDAVREWASWNRRSSKP